jgi:hypothetical protein
MLRDIIDVIIYYEAYMDGEKKDEPQYNKATGPTQQR